MKSPKTTVVLLVIVILASLWASGRIDKLLNAAFGSDEAAK